MNPYPFQNFLEHKLLGIVRVGGEGLQRLLATDSRRLLSKFNQQQARLIMTGQCVHRLRIGGVQQLPKQNRGAFRFRQPAENRQLEDGLRRNRF